MQLFLIALFGVGAAVLVALVGGVAIKAATARKYRQGAI